MWMLIVWLSLGVSFACAWIARDKNRNENAWFFLGALFSIVALIAVAALPALDDDD